MFTGIITDVTDIQRSEATAEGLTMTFVRPKGWKNMRLGESLATNGVCLTVAKLSADAYDCFLMPETLAKTSFGVHLPKAVNLERPLKAGDEFGGHFVQGHVDCVGTVAGIDTSDGYQVSINFPSANRALVVPKGSITIDGVSLTVIEVSDHTLSVGLIPHTLSTTTLQDLKTGDTVNLEFDMIGKYIVNVMEQRK
jgi:riboflavin synthase